MSHGMWDLKVPDQGLNPCSLQWKHGTLTTALPQKSQDKMNRTLGLSAAYLGTISSSQLFYLAAT